MKGPCPCTSTSEKGRKSCDPECSLQDVHNSCCIPLAAGSHPGVVSVPHYGPVCHTEGDTAFKCPQTSL